MSSEKTEAIVIRQTDFSETSRVVQLFTRDFGRISCMAKGARRLRNPFEAALDLLSESHIVFIRKSSTTLDLLTEAKLISRFRPAPGNLRSLYGGYYIAELLSGLTEDYDPHPALYDQVTLFLERIAEQPDPTETLLRFELMMLREMGQLPAFDQCEVCGKSVELHSSWVFWVSQSGLLCPGCRHDQYEQHSIQPGTLAVLRKLSEALPVPNTHDQPSEDRADRNLVISRTQHQEIRRILTAALSRIMGRRPKMLRYLFS